MSKYILKHGTFFAVDDSFLSHAVRANSLSQQRDEHKYIKREWKNGKWVYTYETDTSTAKKTSAASDPVAKANAAKQALIDERSKVDGGDKHVVQVKQHEAVVTQKAAVEAIREQTAKAKASVATGKQAVDNIINNSEEPTVEETVETEETEAAKTTAKKQEEKKKTGGGSGSGKKTDKLADAEKYQQEAQSDLEAAQAYYEEVLARFEAGNATQEEVDAAKARVDMFQKAVNTAKADVEKIKSDAAKKKKKKKTTTTKNTTTTTKTTVVGTKTVSDPDIQRLRDAAHAKVGRLLDEKEKPSTTTK